MEGERAMMLSNSHFEKITLAALWKMLRDAEEWSRCMGQGKK
jgi:hypothetical protein